MIVQKLNYQTGRYEVSTDAACPVDNNSAAGKVLKATAHGPLLDEKTAISDLPMAALTKSGVKFDNDKVQFELLPGDALKAIAVILTFGAKKYSARNWELGMDWSRVFGALQRHLWAWWGGENLDPETGKSHLWHSGCCIVFLIAYEGRGVGKDDRPNSVVSS